MEFGFYARYPPPNVHPLTLVDRARLAENLGFESVWVAETWGTDAVSILAFIGAQTERILLGSAVLQIGARSPMTVAQTAATLDRMSNGRFLLGLGTSGPQVLEGWHGLPWKAPHARTRDYVAIIRKALSGAPVTHQGDRYSVPYPGTREAIPPVTLEIEPVQARIPILLAALRPRAVALACEIADGWIPIFFAPELSPTVYAAELAQAPSSFQISPVVDVVIGDDLERMREDLRPHVALYVGGMGSRDVNFYRDTVEMYGFADAAQEIQDLYLAGKPREAAARVPDALIDLVALVGSRERVADRLDAWREAGVTRLLCSTNDDASLRALAEVAL